MMQSEIYRNALNDLVPQRALDLLAGHLKVDSTSLSVLLGRCWVTVISAMIVATESEQGHKQAYATIMSNDVDIRFIHELERHVIDITCISAIECSGRRLAREIFIPEMATIADCMAKHERIGTHVTYTLLCIALAMLLCKLKRSLIAEDAPSGMWHVFLSAEWSRALCPHSQEMAFIVKQDCAALLSDATQAAPTRIWEILSWQAVMSRQEIRYTLDLLHLPTSREVMINRAEDALSAGNVVQASAVLDSADVIVSDPCELILRSQSLLLRGKSDEARGLIDLALMAAPESEDALVAKARYVQSVSTLQDAQPWFERAWIISDKSATWIRQWIDGLIRLGRYEHAASIAKSHCDRVSEDGESWFWLGYALHLSGNRTEALEAYLKCATLSPGRSMLCNNIAALYLDINDHVAAIFHAKRALEQDPNNALAWTNLGNAYAKIGKVRAAEVAVERALTLAPNAPRTLQAYSYVMKELGRWESALAHIERAHASLPNDGSILWSLAMLQLVRGDYRQGWVNHEYRWNGSGELRRKFPSISAPMWQGESLSGKTIYVWGEQGLGDVLQFSRFLPCLADRVKRAGGRVIYSAFSEVFSLFCRTFGDVIDEVRNASLNVHPICDYHIPLCSLPYRLEIDVKDLPYSVRYLKTDPALVNHWKHVLHADKNFKVGLVWTGRTDHQRNLFRSIDPDMYADAFRTIRGVTFYNLQVTGRKEAESLSRTGMQLVDHTDQFLDISDTAAFMENLDLVVTVCTSVAHLAGALGIRSYLLLDTNPHWVWMTDRSDSPWYPSTVLYRQSVSGQWRPVLEQVAEDLTLLAVEHSEMA